MKHDRLIPSTNVKQIKTIPRSNWGLMMLMLLFIGIFTYEFCLMIGFDGTFLSRHIFKDGKVFPGRVLQHNVRLINLSLTKVELLTEPMCGCTTVLFPSKTLAPFSYCDIPIRVSVTKSHYGPLDKKITIVYGSGSTYRTKNIEIDYYVLSDGAKQKQI